MKPKETTLAQPKKEHKKAPRAKQSEIKIEIGKLWSKGRAERNYNTLFTLHQAKNEQKAKVKGSRAEKLQQEKEKRIEEAPTLKKRIIDRFKKFKAKAQARKAKANKK